MAQRVTVLWWRLGSDTGVLCSAARMQKIYGSAVEFLLDGQASHRILEDCMYNDIRYISNMTQPSGQA
jgi:hypothetical protein